MLSMVSEATGLPTLNHAETKMESSPDRVTSVLAAPKSAAVTLSA